MKIRLPEDVRKGIEEAAAANRRSMNAEILLRLQHSLEKEPVVLVDMNAGKAPDYNKLNAPSVRDSHGGYVQAESQLLAVVRQLPKEQQQALLVLLTK